MVLASSYLIGWWPKERTSRLLSGLALIAVANKLLKQVFGVVKNECMFDRNYYKKSPDLFVFLHSSCCKPYFLVNIKHVYPVWEEATSTCPCQFVFCHDNLLCQFF